MSAYKRIKKSDVVTVPYTANKQWDFSYLSLSSSSIYVYTGVKMTGSFNPTNEPTTSNNQYQRLVYDSINHQFYQKYSGSLINDMQSLQSLNYESASIYQASGSYFPTHNISYDVSYFPEDIGSIIHTIKIPANIFGNAINKNTFLLSSSAYQIQDDGYGNLIDGNTYVGNIFYSYGTVVITNPDYQSYFPSTPFSLHFKNEHILYEKIIKCTVKSTEFNLSYNASLLQSGSFENLVPFATSSSFSPFVTSLGMYDEEGELLAVAKFSQPVPMSAATDYNFIVKFDL